MDTDDIEDAIDDVIDDYNHNADCVADMVIDRIIETVRPILGKSQLELELLFADLRNEIASMLSLPSSRIAKDVIGYLGNDERAATAPDERPAS
jgi:hypothetical protein